MSGGSAPPTCKNAHPNPAEIAEVNRIWQNPRVGASVSGVSQRGIDVDGCFEAVLHS
jgi:hypothetical protein